MTSDELKTTLILLGFNKARVSSQFAAWTLGKDGMLVSYYSESKPSYFVSLRGQNKNMVFHKEQQILNLINGDDYEYTK